MIAAAILLYTFIVCIDFAVHSKKSKLFRFMSTFALSMPAIMAVTLDEFTKVDYRINFGVMLLFYTVWFVCSIMRGSHRPSSE